MNLPVLNVPGLNVPVFNVPVFKVPVFKVPVFKVPGTNLPALLLIILIGLNGCASREPFPDIAHPLAQHLWIPCGDGGEESCRASIFLPPGANAPAPTVVMAHGFTFTREYLYPYAEKFAQAGFAVLAFDYRNFGGSQGNRRFDIDALEQLNDWRSAIAYTKSRTDIFDGNRLGLWGTSYSGGHVLVLASERDDLKAVVSQVADTGYPTGNELSTWFMVRAATAIGVDSFLSLFGAAYYIDASADEGSLAGMANDSVNADLKKVIDGISPNNWRNQIPASVLLRASNYKPEIVPSAITAPTLLFAAADDSITPYEGIAKIAEGIKDCQFERIESSHFAVYLPPYFQQIVSEQTRFFERHLR